MTQALKLLKLGEEHDTDVRRKIMLNFLIEKRVTTKKAEVEEYAIFPLPVVLLPEPTDQHPFLLQLQIDVEGQMVYP